MKILVVSNLYPPIVFGGYEILCHQVCEQLHKWGHQIEVLTSDFRASECQDQAVRQLRLTTDFPLPGQSVEWVDFRLQTLQRIGSWNYAKTIESIERFQPDVVFCWCLSRLSLACVRAAQVRQIPVAYTINDEHPRQFIPARWGLGLKKSLKSVAEKWLWPLTTMRDPAFPITIISQATRSRLLEAGLPIAHSRVIHQGIPLERFPMRASFASAPRKILYVGQLSRTKGVHTLIQALAQLGKQDKVGCEAGSDWSLDIVGDGVPEYTRELESLVHQHGLQQQVTFLGRLPHQQLPEVYREHEVFVFPSEWEEPFGLTHLEAMASGCAVISTTTGGSKELIRDQVNALAYQAGDATALASCLQKILYEPGLGQALSLGGRAYVEEHHSLEVYSQRLQRFLQDVVADS